VSCSDSDEASSSLLTSIEASLRMGWRIPGLAPLLPASYARRGGREPPAPAR
jgi:hypothetical protein